MARACRAMIAVTNGGRVLCVTALGTLVAQAQITRLSAGGRHPVARQLSAAKISVIARLRAASDSDSIRS